MNAHNMNRSLTLAWRDDCDPDEVYLKVCLDTLAHLPACTPAEARDAARGLRDAVEGIVGCGVLSRESVLSAADTLDALAAKMHEPPSAHDTILDTCRGCGFKTRGTWGMRSDVLLGGYGTTERTPCAVIDLARTAPHPTRYGFSVPIVLASGPTWEAVLDTLRAAGELP